MIYKLKVLGYDYPVRLNLALIPIIYIDKIDINKYQVCIMGVLGDANFHKHFYTIDARENRSFVEFMGGEVEE